MADPKGRSTAKGKGRAREGSFKLTAKGVSKRADQMMADVRSGKTPIKGGVAAPVGGLAARLAAVKAAQATQGGATAAAAAAKTSPWVARNLAGQQTPKVLAAGAPMAAPGQKKKATPVAKPKPSKATTAKRRVR